MYPFTYRRPKTLADAQKLFGEAESASFLSGGHTLLPALKMRLAMPSDLIDLGAIPELNGIRLDDGTLSIGATTRHCDVAASPLVGRHIPALAGLAGSIGDRHVRHRGTIGGSVANNDPAADYPAGVLGLGATVVTNQRQIPADKFFVALYETALEPGEIVTRIVFPIPEIASYAKFRSAASRYSVAAVFVARTGSTVRVAVTGAGARGVFRPAAIEAALTADFRPEAIAGCTIDPDTLLGDQTASAAYRANLVVVLARRAMEKLGTVQSFK
jgi:carbon-monoxide dehydrogenase medium subunit